MMLFTVLAALGVDYYRPLARPSKLDLWLEGQANWLLNQFNAGTQRHVWLAWTVGALLPALVAGMVVGLLKLIALPLAWAASVLVLYFALGYRHMAVGVMDAVGALSVGDIERARRFESDWCRDVSPDMDAESLARCGIKTVFHQALYRLFAVLFWFLLLGVAGAVLYALTRSLADRWQGEALFKGWLDRVLYALEWLPARGLAISFAAVGNFDNALAGWRKAARSGAESNAVIVEASGAGALGIRLEPASDESTEENGQVVGRAAPSADYMEGAVNLIWRALLLWLALLALLWLFSL